MKKMVKTVVYFCISIIFLLIMYVVIALALSAITVERQTPLSSTEETKTVYIHSNNVHLDIAMNKRDLSPDVMQDIIFKTNAEYLSFGWGDENFYLNTPTWSDLTLSTAIQAMFLQSSTLMHVTFYQQPESHWVAIEVSNEELAKLNQYLAKSFKVENGNKLLLNGKGYSDMDDFYQANSSYNLFNTCNTWVNSGFKNSGLKASYWTPFDFGLLNKYDD